jgi:UDP-glucose 4-epimerase
VVKGNLLASEKTGVAGKIINMADGRQTTLLRLIELLNEMLGTETKVDFQPARIGDVRESLADVSLARNLLGYHPEVTLEDGLRQTIHYYRQLAEAKLR